MNLEHITYQGPKIDDEDILELLPNNLASLLGQINGFVQYHGGLHLFGACLEPKWHSIRELWHGSDAACKHYKEIRESDVPFAEDCLGFQFFLRDKQIIFLDGETGDVDYLNMGLREFFQWVSENPIENLAMAPLQQFLQDGNECMPGQVLSEYPPFCTKESEDGVSLKAVSSIERRSFLVELSKQLSSVEDGGNFKIKWI